jgi:hypothetical protein
MLRLVPTRIWVWLEQDSPQEITEVTYRETEGARAQDKDDRESEIVMCS